MMMSRKGTFFVSEIESESHWMMFQSFNGGRSVRIVSKFIKRFARIGKSRFAKKLFMLSMLFKIVVLIIPISSVPAHATALQVPEIRASNEIVLSRDQTVVHFNAASVVIKSGESNTTIIKEQELKERQKTVVAQKTFVTTAAPNLAELRLIYAAAGDRFTVPFELIEAVHQVESGKSWDTAHHSSAGAVGPMQFMPGTWAAYAVDAGGGGRITSARDSIFTAARYMRAHYDSGGSWDSALYAYNHSTRYVSMVKQMARELGADL